VPPRRRFRALDPESTNRNLRDSISRCTSSRSAGTFWRHPVSGRQPRGLAGQEPRIGGEPDRLGGVEQVVAQIRANGGMNPGRLAGAARPEQKAGTVGKRAPPGKHSWHFTRKNANSNERKARD
jgi:hypothetical protein